MCIRDRYSQKQENAADDYGFEFSIANGIDPYSMYNSLNKLLELSVEAPKSSKFRQLFSSHPETQKRVKRMKAVSYTHLVRLKEPVIVKVMTTKTQQIRIEDFDYPLPDERIAKFPLPKRDESKLLLYKEGKVSESIFKHITDYLPEGYLMEMCIRDRL